MSELSVSCFIFVFWRRSLYSMLTIVIADSRGRYLDTWVDNEEILISFHSGAKLMNVAYEALKIIPRFKPEIILLMAGVNDLTTLNGRTRRVSLISTSRSYLIHHLITEINRAKSTILAAFPTVKVVIGGILGFDMNTYNRLPGTYYWQYVIDDTITAVNSYICQINRDSGFPHPRLTSKIHTWRRGIRKCVYHRLYDGLHPNELVLRAWAKGI